MPHQTLPLTLDRMTSFHPAETMLNQLIQDPDQGLALVNEHPTVFNAWASPEKDRQDPWRTLHAQAWHAMSQHPDRFERWLGWWSDRWNDAVVREEPVESVQNTRMLDLLPMMVWGRSSPALPDDTPWPVAAHRFWQRLADHSTGWFDRRQMGAATSQFHELDALGYNPMQEAVTSVLGVAVVRGQRAHAQEWIDLGARWDVAPHGLKSHVVLPLLVALVRPDATTWPVVEALTTQTAWWGKNWGHANIRNQAPSGWKPAWLMPRPRGHVWDVMAQHPDPAVREPALRGLLTLSAGRRSRLLDASGLPPATLQQYLCDAEALVLREALSAPAMPVLDGLIRRRL